MSGLAAGTSDEELRKAFEERLDRVSSQLEPPPIPGGPWRVVVEKGALDFRGLFGHARVIQHGRIMLRRIKQA